MLLQLPNCKTERSIIHHFFMFIFILWKRRNGCCWSDSWLYGKRIWFISTIAPMLFFLSALVQWHQPIQFVIIIFWSWISKSSSSNMSLLDNDYLVWYNWSRALFCLYISWNVLWWSFKPSFVVCVRHFFSYSFM